MNLFIVTSLVSKSFFNETIVQQISASLFPDKESAYRFIEISVENYSKIIGHELHHIDKLKDSSGPYLYEYVTNYGTKGIYEFNIYERYL